MRWQQRLRFGIAVFGAGFSSSALLRVSYAEAAATPAAGPVRVTRDHPVARAPRARRKLRVSCATSLFRIEYDQLAAYPDGRQTP